MRRPGVAVEMRDREIIGDLHVTLLDLSRRPGRGIIGLFMEDPKTLLDSVATREGVVSTEVWFVNSYPEYLNGKDPRRTSDHGTWHLRKTTRIKSASGQIIGYKIEYDCRPRRNEGREQGPTLGLREYTYNSRGRNLCSLCIIYEKRKKRKSNRREGVDQVEKRPDHEEAPELLQTAGAANPNYAASPPYPIFVVAPPFPAEPAIKSSEEVEEARDSDEDASKYGWFGFEDMTTYDLGSLHFSEGGCKHNEQSLCIPINEERPKKKPERNGEGVLLFQSNPEEAPVLQMAAANPNYAGGPSTAATAAALEGWDSADDSFKDDFVGLPDDFFKDFMGLDFANDFKNYLASLDSADDFSKNDFGSLDFSD